MRNQTTAADLGRLTPGLRTYLYLTAFLTGAAVLVVEILGARMLSPFVGTSHFVWMAQITVTLMALAVGYYAGGWLADRRPQLDGLYYCILAAAVFLCGSVLVCRELTLWCLRFKLALGALLASFTLFFLPLGLLATTVPFLTRILTRSVASVGSQIGRLSAIGTVGSVAGAIAIGYLVIPYLRNTVTMYLTAGSLMALVAGYFLVWSGAWSSRMAVLCGAFVGLSLGLAGIQRDRHLPWDDLLELHRQNSPFGLLQVVQTLDGKQRYYLNDLLSQNTYDLTERRSSSLFTYMLHSLAQAYTPRIQSVLCIGLGIGCVPSDFARDGAQVEVVEINPSVVDLARKYFDLDTSRFNLWIGDGRCFLNGCQRQYDAVILDAFLGDSSPSHLMSREAFQEIRRVLRPTGTLVINTFSDFNPGQDFSCASLDKTLRQVFRSVRIHDSGIGNVFFVASDQTPLPILHPPDPEKVHPYWRSTFRDAFANVRSTEAAHGQVLTDDHNPVDFYDAANREALRKRLVARWLRSSRR